MARLSIRGISSLKTCCKSCTTTNPQQIEPGELGPNAVVSRAIYCMQRAAFFMLRYRSKRNGDGQLRQLLSIGYHVQL